MKTFAYWLALIFASIPILAQNGTVSGHVYLADTNRPARIATVMLESEADLNTCDAGKECDIRVFSQTTGLDGSFVISDVPEGSYYVIAGASGYVSPLDAAVDSRQDFLRPDKATKEKYTKLIPRIALQPNGSAAVELRLEPGAAISGRVVFDDGSPATGLTIRPLVRIKDKWVAFKPNIAEDRPEMRTDDRGRYRFAGLPAGAYLIEVDIKPSASRSYLGMDPGLGGTPIQVYTGGAFFRSDAKPIYVKLGEDRATGDLLISPGKFHTVSGEIVAAGDGHLLNCCTVWLSRADDNTTIQTVRIGHLDNRFTFSMIPEGDYVLRATGQDVEYANKGWSMTLIHGYDSVQQPLHVGGNFNALTITATDSVEQPDKE